LEAQNSQLDNIIDLAFAESLPKAESEGTPKYNYVVYQYQEAWQKEFDNVTALLLKTYKFRDDQRIVEVFAEKSREMAKAAEAMAWLQYTLDTQSTPYNRTVGTGAAGAGSLAQMQVYRQAALTLITHFNSLDGQEQYQYIYRPE
jgi:hypothetical protein